MMGVEKSKYKNYWKALNLPQASPRSLLQPWNQCENKMKNLKIEKKIKERNKIQMGCTLSDTETEREGVRISRSTEVGRRLPQPNIFTAQEDE